MAYRPQPLTQSRRKPQFSRGPAGRDRGCLFCGSVVLAQGMEARNHVSRALACPAFQFGHDQVAIGPQAARSNQRLKW